MQVGFSLGLSAERLGHAMYLSHTLLMKPGWEPHTHLCVCVSFTGAVGPVTGGRGQTPVSSPHKGHRRGVWEWPWLSSSAHSQATLASQIMSEGAELQPLYLNAPVFLLYLLLREKNSLGFSFYSKIAFHFPLQALNASWLNRSNFSSSCGNGLHLAKLFFVEMEPACSPLCCQPSTLQNFPL